MNTDIKKLRKERRPLWMTELGIENEADMLGGGGDVDKDRIHGEWSVRAGYEEEDELSPEDIEIALAGPHAGEDYVS